MSDFRPTDCLFCSLAADRIIESNAHALAIADAFPISAGHTLILPRRHVISFFELNNDEVAAVYELLRGMKIRLDESRGPSGYNVGINIGAVAGQTVAHAHVHLIPRYPGDVPDPVGGVRNIIPGQGRYSAVTGSQE